MRLRTFIADDMRAAMAQIRAELGEEAVIVSSQKAKGTGVLVRVAIDEDLADERIEEAVAAHLDAESAAEAAPAAAAANDFTLSYHDGLLRRLRGPAPAKPAATRNFNRAELLGILRGHRMADALSHALAEAAEKTKLSDMTLALAAALDKRMKAAPLELARTAGLLLVGPHGAGKTAVAAKLAAHAALAGRSVKLIAGDAKGAGAVERLKTFADHIGVPFAVADDVEALANLVRECCRENLLAIVDTAGFDPRQGKSRSAFSALARIEGLEALGVVSAAGDAEETAEIAAALTSLGARRSIVTGLDLTRRLGALAAAAANAQGLAHVTRSPFLAGALETLTPLSLARALIEASAQNADRGSPQ